MTDQADSKWTTSGWGLAIKSQDQAFRAITRIGSLSAGRQYVWRGSSNRAYRIRSSLLRTLIVDERDPLPTESELRRQELAILREAREWGLALDIGTLASDLYLLAHLQHHGVATRLLDVTSNPVTAPGSRVRPRTRRASCSPSTSPTSPGTRPSTRITSRPLACSTSRWSGGFDGPYGSRRRRACRSCSTPRCPTRGCRRRKGCSSQE